MIKPLELIEKVSTITQIDIREPRKSKTRVLLRQAVFFHLRKLGYSYPEIGELFGKNHTTIMHAVNNPSIKDNAYINMVGDLLSSQRRP